MSVVEQAIFKLTEPITISVVCPRCMASYWLIMDEDGAGYECPGACGVTFSYSLHVLSRA